MIALFALIVVVSAAPAPEPEAKADPKPDVLVTAPVTYSLGSYYTSPYAAYVSPYAYSPYAYSYGGLGEEWSEIWFTINNKFLKKLWKFWEFVEISVQSEIFKNFEFFPQKNRTKTVNYTNFYFLGYAYTYPSYAIL